MLSSVAIRLKSQSISPRQCSIHGMTRAIINMIPIKGLNLDLLGFHDPRFWRDLICLAIELKFVSFFFNLSKPFF